MTDSILFPHHSNLKEVMPVYANIAEVSNRIVKCLNDRSTGSWKHIDVTEPLMQLHSHLLDMMKKGQLNYETLAFIYEARPQGKVTNTNEELQSANLTIETIFENRIVYFPDHDIAITQVSFYSYAETSWPEFQCYAKSVEAAYSFLQAMDELLRRMLMNNITFLVDTEEGVRRKNFSTQAIIERSDVILDDSVKKDIFRSIDEFFKEDGRFFTDYGIPYKRGILLYGSPGNGKTTLVKSITGSTEAPVVYWQITEYTNSATIQEVFSIVSRLAPAILVIEDIDSMPDYTRSVFLNTLDGTQAREGLFVIGTTNYPEKIDPALINRAGRFDRAYEIPSPSHNLRKAYLQKLDIKQIFSESQLIDMASRTKGLSISQLNELYMSSALNWHYDGDTAYIKRIEELQQQNKRSERNDWQETDSYIGF